MALRGVYIGVLLGGAVLDGGSQLRCGSHVHDGKVLQQPFHGGDPGCVDHRAGR